MKKINIRRIYFKLKKDFFNLNNAVIFVAFIIASSWIWGSLTMMQRNFTLQKELDDKSRQLVVAQLDTENAKLEQRYYQTDEYKELAVRQRLGLVTPGERLLVLPLNSQAVIDSDKAAATKPSATVAKVSNFNQWVDFLLGNNSKRLSK